MHNPARTSRRHYHLSFPTIPRDLSLVSPSVSTPQQSLPLFRTKWNNGSLGLRGMAGRQQSELSARKRQLQCWTHWRACSSTNLHWQRCAVARLLALCTNHHRCPLTLAARSPLWVTRTGTTTTSVTCASHHPSPNHCITCDTQAQACKLPITAKHNGLQR